MNLKLGEKVKSSRVVNWLQHYQVSTSHFDLDQHLKFSIKTSVTLSHLQRHCEASVADDF